MLKSPKSGNLGSPSHFSSVCMGTECTGNMEGQLLHARREMGMGVRGALLNSVIPANPGSWLSLILFICVSSAVVWQGCGLRSTECNANGVGYSVCPSDLCPTLSSLLLSCRLGIRCFTGKGGGKGRFAVWLIEGVRHWETREDDHKGSLFIPQRSSCH